MTEAEWYGEVLHILLIISKEYEPSEEVIKKMGWCCYCKKKLSEDDSCSCFP